MDNRHLIINPGRTRNGQVFVKIEYNNGRLSMTGVEGPLASGNCKGSCGQIDDELAFIVGYNEGWDEKKVKELRKIWRRWHLNDMRAGSPRQEAFVRGYLESGNRYDYAFIMKALEDNFLLYDDAFLVDGKPYRYGTRWIEEKVPDYVIDWLFRLPESKKRPAWV